MEKNQNFNILRFMAKLDRLAAWILFFTAIAYAITGYGLTKNLIDPDVAALMHLGWLGALGLIAFVVHASYAIHLSLRRWGIWNKFSKAGLILFFLSLVVFFSYIHFFYKAPSLIENVSPVVPEQVLLETKNQDAVIEQVKVFTSETLSQYNGKNGQKSYIAVDGIVYDVSTLFRNGEHKGCYAGEDVSMGFHDEHSSRLLERFEVVGKYQD